MLEKQIEQHFHARTSKIMDNLSPAPQSELPLQSLKALYIFYFLTLTPQVVDREMKPVLP